MHSFICECFLIFIVLPLIYYAITYLPTAHVIYVFSYTLYYHWYTYYSITYLPTAPVIYVFSYTLCYRWVYDITYLPTAPIIYVFSFFICKCFLIYLLLSLMYYAITYLPTAPIIYVFSYTYVHCTTIDVLCYHLSTYSTYHICFLIHCSDDCTIIDVLFYHLSAPVINVFSYTLYYNWCTILSTICIVHVPIALVIYVSKY